MSEPNYPCADCGAARTKDQGGTVFAVCDACWDKSITARREKPMTDYLTTIADLRTQVAELTRERDEIRRLVNSARTRHERVLEETNNVRRELAGKIDDVARRLESERDSLRSQLTATKAALRDLLNEYRDTYDGGSAVCDSQAIVIRSLILLGREDEATSALERANQKRARQGVPPLDIAELRKVGE